MGAGNKGKGGKAYRSGKGEGAMGNRNLILKDEFQAYARVKRNLGCFRLDVTVDDGSTINAIVRGTMRKKAICAVGSTILISFRETGEKVADVIHLYKDFEVKELAAKGLIPSDFISQDDDEALRKQQDGKGYTIVKQIDMSTTNAKIEIKGGTVRTYDPLAPLGMAREDELDDYEPAVYSNPNKPAAATKSSLREAATEDAVLDGL